MRAEPRFSIITVVLNNRDGLERTARSVVTQKHGCFEWIVIDGGSTDGTVELITSLASQIACWVSEPDQGLYDAMNKGLTLARGEYVNFMNSGDIYYDDEVLEAVEHEIALLDRPVSMIFGPSLYEYPNGHRVVQPARPIEEHIWHRMPASHQAIFLNREWHQQLPFDPAYRICGDYHSVARMYRRHPDCAYVDRLIAVTAHGGSSFAYRHPWGRVLEAARIQSRVLGASRHAIARSGARRCTSCVAEYLLSHRHLAPLAWPLVQRLRARAARSDAQAGVSPSARARG
jgi:putative colanic acid biosynthesis glycosyltransferase